MNWGYFFAWAAAIFGVFLVTGWPVTPHLQGYWGNHFAAKNLTYYAVLYIHYVLGALFFTFLAVGMFRNLIFKGERGGNRQLAFVLAYSMLAATAVAVYLTHQYSPTQKNDEIAQEPRAEEQAVNDDKT